MTTEANVSGATRRLTNKVETAHGQSVMPFLVSDVRDVLKRNADLEAENKRLREALDRNENAFRTCDAGTGTWAV